MAKMGGLTLQVQSGELTIHRLPPDSPLPSRVLQSEFFSISRTTEELSLVCDAVIEIESEQAETGWSAIKVIGPLDFSLTGILANLSQTLAASEISIFAISTYDTDYILLASAKLDLAIDALGEAGHNFV